MNIDLTRRGFLRLAGAGVAATSLGAMGFGEAEAAEAAETPIGALPTSLLSKENLRLARERQPTHLKGNRYLKGNPARWCSIEIEEKI